MSPNVSPQYIRDLLEKIRREYGYSAVERAFSLPYDYFARLETHFERSGRLEAEDLALLRIINFIPWILEVAANNYKDADKIMIDNVLIKPEQELQRRIMDKAW